MRLKSKATRFPAAAPQNKFRDRRKKNLGDCARRHRCARRRELNLHYCLQNLLLLILTLPESTFYPLEEPGKGGRSRGEPLAEMFLTVEGLRRLQMWGLFSRGSTPPGGRPSLRDGARLDGAFNNTHVRFNPSAAAGTGLGASLRATPSQTVTPTRPLRACWRAREKRGASFDGLTLKLGGSD